MLNKRQERIIMLLTDNNTWKTGRQLSGIFNVSDRTIRSDIEKINETNTIHILSDLKKGYSLDLEVVSEDTTITLTVPQTMHQRCTFIINKLLIQETKYNRYDLVEQMHISDISFSKDLKRIDKMLKDYPTLRIVKFRNTICLLGNEAKKRELYKDLIIKDLADNFLNLDILSKQFRNFDLLLVKKWLENVLQTYQYPIKEMEIPSLLIDIGIAMERMLSNNYISITINSDAIVQSVEYAITSEFLKRTSKRFFLRITEEEVISFAMQLQISKDEKQVVEEESSTKERKELANLVDTILEDIYDVFAIDFRKDKQLNKGLCSYIQSLQKQNIENQIFSNIYMQEMKRKYPFTFEIALRVSEHITNILGIIIWEDDISFLAQYIGVAMENLNLENKYKILMIYPNSLPFVKEYTEKIKQLFSHTVSTIEYCNYFEEKKVLECNPDLLLTTLPITHNLDILTMQVSTFITREEERKIAAVLRTLEQKQILKNVTEKILPMFDSQFFSAKQEFHTAKDTIHFMCSQLLEKGMVSSDFEKAVLHRERISTTSFVYSFALPHPVAAKSKESKIAITILEKPILWGEFEITLVMLLALRKEDQKYIQIFFDWIQYIVRDTDMLVDLMQCQEYQTFIDIVQEKAR